MPTVIRAGRQRERRLGQRHAEQVVVQADLLEQQEQRQGRGVEREQQPDDERQVKRFAAAEGVAGQREGLRPGPRCPAGGLR
jgi:hypothetical protein